MPVNVIDESLGVIGSRRRCKEDASDAFLQRGSQRINDCFVKVVYGFLVIPGPVKKDGFFRLNDVTKNLPQDSATIFQSC
jgi:hypothetical protein